MIIYIGKRRIIFTRCSRKRSFIKSS